MNNQNNASYSLLWAVNRRKSIIGEKLIWKRKGVISEVQMRAALLAIDICLLLQQINTSKMIICLVLGKTAASLP